MCGGLHTLVRNKGPLKTPELIIHEVKTQNSDRDSLDFEASKGFDSRFLNRENPRSYSNSSFIVVGPCRSFSFIPTNELNKKGGKEPTPIVDLKTPPIEYILRSDFAQFILMVQNGAAPPRGSAAAAASLRRRRTTSGATAGGASGNMLQFYTDDAPGLKISPNVVLVMSIGFIAFVAFSMSWASSTLSGKRPKMMAAYYSALQIVHGCENSRWVWVIHEKYFLFHRNTVKLCFCNVMWDCWVPWLLLLDMHLETFTSLLTSS
ncbi:Protein transport protein Sec61 subunit beta [Vitis vinifera]|uniref:Protein transport protein Sec61 subunit beta n=1 Tax=Vitis vinifera TaxID=29760 RepID=A0A438BWE0_VITVI|nr:Protein transport protein Sec61 subunit beta [Vitis vinifera]